MPIQLQQKRWSSQVRPSRAVWIGFRFGHRRSIAGASVSPLPSASSFAAFALSAIAITFWYAGTKPGIVAVLLSSLIRALSSKLKPAAALALC